MARKAAQEVEEEVKEEVKESEPKIYDGMKTAPEGWKTIKEWAQWFKDELADYQTSEVIIEESGIRAALKPSKNSEGKVVAPAIRRGGPNPEAVKLANNTVVISPEAERVRAWKDKLDKIKERVPKKVNQSEVELERLRGEFEALKAEKERLGEELEALKKENEDRKMQLALVPAEIENAQLKAKIALLEEGWVKRQD